MVYDEYDLPESKAENFKIETTTNWPEILWLSGLINSTRFIAGGCFRDIFTHRKDKIRDIDIWHTTQEALEKTKLHMTTSPDYAFKYTNPNVVAFTHLPTKMTLELITCQFGSPNDILSKFDFTVSKFAMFKETNELKVMYHKRYFLDIQSRTLSISGPVQSADGLFNRIIKYANYGFAPELDLKIRLWELIRNSDVAAIITSVKNAGSYGRTAAGVQAFTAKMEQEILKEQAMYVPLVPYVPVGDTH